MNIEQAATALDGALSAYNIDCTAADLTNGRRRLQITNGSTGAGGISGAYRFRTLPDGDPDSFTSELNISGNVAIGGSRLGNIVLHEHTVSLINIGEMRVDQVRNTLNNAAITALNSDGLTNPTGNVIFELNSLVADERGINMHTSAVNARYQIELRGTSGDTIDELFGGDQDLSREAASVIASAIGTTRDYGKFYDTLDGGSNIEELRADVDALGILEATWITEPNYTGQHNGRFAINNIDGTPERREVVFTGAAGVVTQLMGGPTTIRAGSNANTQTWLARDNVTITTTYEGIRANGTAVNGSNTSTWWEGERGDLNPLAGIGALPFTSVYIPDSSTGPDLAVNDSWALFTSARSAGNHDVLDFRIRDGVTGSTYDSTALGSPNQGTQTYGGASMVFNDGVLDSVGTMFALPHFFRTGVGTFDSDASNVSFIDNGFDSITGSTFGNVLRTAERYGAAGAGWDVAGTENDHWYAQEWYGEETSYYLGGKDPNTVLGPNAIRVWRQEDTNACILFTCTGNNTYHVEGEGYNRDGSRVEFEEDIDLNAHGAVTASNPLILNAGGGNGAIRFDAFAPTGTEVDDRFVVNVAARAGSTYENAAPGAPAGFISDAVVTIDADPWSLTGGLHRTMEYRFDAGAENSFYDANPSADPEDRLQMFGFFVDPNNSDNNTNISSGRLLLNVAASGFASGTQAGEGPGWMPYAVAEVNYQGLTTPEAGALVNSFYFQDIHDGEGERDFLERIEYDQEETRNALLLFDVLEAENGSVTVRIQGHIVDREGNYRYAEEERITLGSTNEDMFFLGSPYLQGLHFHHFDFTDISRLRQGDRFTLSLVADGRDEYDPGEDQYAVDEIDLFGGDTNPGIYPISWRFFDGVLDNKTTVLHTYQVTPKVLSFGSEAFQGKVHDGELSLSFGDFHGGTPLGDGSDTTPRTVRDTAIFSSVYREGIDGGVAHRYSSLRDIAQFWDKNGKFLLDDPVTITIRRGDKESPFTLYGNEEIHALLGRLNAALYDELGEGELSYLMPSSSKEKFVTFTGPLAGKNMIESVEGTLILRSAFAGEKGSYEFRGDEQILQALGLTVIQEARDTTYSISVTDAHSGKGVASGLKVAGGDDLHGIWGDAVRLRFDALLGISGVQYNEQTGRFVLGSASEVYRTVHLADNATMLQIGANEKEDMLLSLGAVDAETLGVHNISVGDSEHAGRSITVIDAAIDRVSRHRAQYGALVNRLGHATSALTVTSENLSAAESRIRDLDFAKEMMEFTKLNILTQVGTSMLTQANQLPKNVLSLLQ